MQSWETIKIVLNYLEDNLGEKLDIDKLACKAYVLSFYNQSKNDERFLEALAALQTKLANEMIVVERVVPKLANLSFCKKGQPSELAAKRYQEILKNIQEIR